MLPGVKIVKNKHVRSTGVPARELSAEGARRLALESRLVNSPFSMDLKPPPEEVGVGGTGVDAAVRAFISSTSEASAATSDEDDKGEHNAHIQ